MSHVSVSVQFVTPTSADQPGTTIQEHVTPKRDCKICNQSLRIGELETILTCCSASYHAECFSDWFGDSNEPKCTVCRAGFSLKPFYNAMTGLAVGSVRLSSNAPADSVRLLHVHVTGDGGLYNDWEQSCRATLRREK